MRPGTILLVALLATSLGVAVAVAGSLMLRAEGTPAVASAAAPSISASAAAPAESATGRETLLTRTPPRSVPAGTVAGESRFVGEFRVQKLESAFGADLAGAQKTCADSSMSLCTEAQWARACDAHPELGRSASWTLSPHPSGFVIRGGASCAVRAVASADTSAPDRGALCCDRAVALDSKNPNRTFLIATAARLIAVEAALNQRQAATFASLLSDFVTVDGKLLPRADVKAQLEDSLARWPDQWFVLDTCQVDMRTPQRTPKPKGKPKPRAKPGQKTAPPEPGGEAASWTAECQEVRHRGGEVSVVSVLYKFGGSGRLLSVQDQKSARAFSPK